jgi:Sec-independent protein translocase protein TatA
MITAIGLAVFLGLLIFGPKKTLEMSQTVARAVAGLKHAARQVQSQIQDELSTQPGGHASIPAAQVETGMANSFPKRGSDS